MQSHYINKLLDLEEVIVQKISHSDHSVKIFLETTPSTHCCPYCNALTSTIHDYRFQTIKDLPLQLKHTFLILKKRRYHCSCGKNFYESYPFLQKYQRCTRRLTYQAVDSLRNTNSMKSVSQMLNLPVSKLSRLLDTLNYTRPPLPECISIDEFKGDADAEKYQCILVDAKKHIILDILPDRKQEHLCTYWKNIPRDERYRVKFFICDMWIPYVELAKVYFPNAKIIIDKYHFIRQMTWAIENVRKRLQKTMPVNLRKYYKRSRKLILTRYQKLKEENKQSCDLMLFYNDDLRRAHRLKEWFYNICQSKKYTEQRTEFWEWIKEAEKSNIPEFEKCAATYRRWSSEILNAFKYGYTNGPTEGLNNKIKVLKRNAFGIRRFSHLRTRILHCTR